MESTYMEVIGECTVRRECTKNTDGGGGGEEEKEEEKVISSREADTREQIGGCIAF